MSDRDVASGGASPGGASAGEVPARETSARETSAGEAERGFTHLDAQGRARMVDVGGKDVTLRTATAEAVVVVSPETARRVAAGELPKGDVAAVARIAGIQAAKRTPELIPLCHTVALTAVDVDVDVDVAGGRIHVTATARAADRTGVEMEALTAVTVASLTVYDLVKAVERGATITDVRLVAKAGGARGDWSREDA